MWYSRPSTPQPRRASQRPKIDVLSMLTYAHNAFTCPVAAPAFCLPVQWLYNAIAVLTSHHVWETGPSLWLTCLACLNTAHVHAI